MKQGSFPRLDQIVATATSTRNRMKSQKINHKDPRMIPATAMPRPLRALFAVRPKPIMPNTIAKMLKPSKPRTNDAIEYPSVGR